MRILHMWEGYNISVGGYLRIIILIINKSETKTVSKTKCWLYYYDYETSVQTKKGLNN